MPAVKPVIAIVPLLACEIDPVIPPGDEVAVYEVIAAPPLDAGAVNETFAVVAPVDVADTEVGAPGTVVVGAPIANVVTSDQELIVPSVTVNVPSEFINVWVPLDVVIGTRTVTCPVLIL